MAITTLEEIYLRQIRDLFNAEGQSVPMLSAMAEAAQNPVLRSALIDHLEETQEHTERLLRLLEEMDAHPGSGVCDAMTGLVRGCEKAIKSHPQSEVRDAALIIAAERIEHHEIAAYGCVRTYADLLGKAEAAVVLQEILDQESDSDLRLAEITKQLKIETEATELCA
jgi:ferritin-like metal-binding protein YciE